MKSRSPVLICDKKFTLVKSRSSVMIVTRRLNDEQDSHCMVRGNRLPVLTARMQDCEEIDILHFQCLLALCLYRHGSFSSIKALKMPYIKSDGGRS